MPSLVSVMIITGYGTNCEAECAHAALEGGADRARIVHFADLRANEARLDEYNFLVFPGGFLDGDDLGAAQAAAQRWKYAADEQGTPLLRQLRAFMDKGGLILGICNGFQLMTKLGLLP
ncbi:MAG: phosphoribosylformylglycinamidine synthase subunit PurQ, partial [Deltaproteobacteria bacterium]|nr:phosphoribosylformylglycinamidine synthase subunit PurQ [Deltaproteobacteria bacterium]